MPFGRNYLPVVSGSGIVAGRINNRKKANIPLLHCVMKFEKLIGLCKWLKIFDKSKPPDAKLANGGFALAKILNPVYIS